MQQRTIMEGALVVAVVMLWLTAQSTHFALERERSAHEREVLRLRDMVVEVKERALRVSGAHCNLTALALKVAHHTSEVLPPPLPPPASPPLHLLRHAIVGGADSGDIVGCCDRDVFSGQFRCFGWDLCECAR